MEEIDCLGDAGTTASDFLGRLGSRHGRILNATECTTVGLDSTERHREVQ